MKKISKILVIALVILSIITTTALFKSIRNYNAFIDHLTLSTLQLNTVPNGTHAGSSDSGIVRVKVDVTVKDHRITKVQILEHINGKGKAAESIIDAVIQKQNIQVDTITGATGSSKVILKAIENALITAH